MSNPSRVSRFAVAAVIGIAAYIAVDIVLAFLRPDQSLVRSAESDYGNGPYRWLMDLNFEIRMVLSLAMVAAVAGALRTRPAGAIGLLLFVVWSLASGVLGFFPDDLEGHPTTAHGAVHLMAARIGFLTCLIGTGLIILARRRILITSARLTHALLWLIAAATLVLLAATGFRPNTLDGLWERIFLAAELAWVAATCWSLRRVGRRAGSER